MRICPPRSRGKHIHAHGARLLGNGGEHRKPRALSTKTFSSKATGEQWGRLGTSEAGDRGVAHDVQQPEVSSATSNNTAIASNPGREKRNPGFQRSHSQSARAKCKQATQAPKAQAAGS